VAVAKHRSIFFDTSVLVGGLMELGPSSRATQRVMNSVAQGRLGRPVTAWHCCLEFYAVSTRLPEGFRLRPADALRLLEEEVLTRFDVHQLRDSKWRAFLRGAADDAVAGGRIYDAHIAEIAHTARAKIVVTENVRHFRALAARGVRVTTAAEFVESL
jgi:predicted nucleic acid-binding protein